MPFKGTDRDAYARAKKGKTPEQRSKLYDKYSKENARKGRSGEKTKPSPQPKPSNFSIDRPYKPKDFTPRKPVRNNIQIQQTAIPKQQPRPQVKTQPPKPPQVNHPHSKVLQIKEFVDKQPLFGSKSDKASFANTVFDVAKNSIKEFVISAAKDLGIELAKVAARHVLKELFPIHIVEKIEKGIAFVETVREYIQLGENLYELVVEIEKKGRKVKTKTTKELITQNYAPKHVRVYRPVHSNQFKVIAEHVSEFPNPIILVKGEQVIIGEDPDPSNNHEAWINWLYCKKLDGSNEGFVPEQIVAVDGVHGTIREDYSAKELTIGEGKILAGLKKLNGWLWAKRIDTGETGWIPLEKVRRL